MLTVLIVVALAPVVFLGAKSVLSSRPDSLGSRNGVLQGCPDSPNCVSSQATDEAHQIAALAFDGSADEAMTRLQRAIETLSRTRVVTAEEPYLHVEFTSLIFRYVDDVEFLVDSAQNQIQVRSASRTGYSDLGANRARVEAIRSAFQGTTEQ